MKKIYDLLFVTDKNLDPFVAKRLNTTCILLFVLGIANIVLSLALLSFKEFSYSYIIFLVLGPLLIMFIPIIKKNYNSGLPIHFILAVGCIIIVYRALVTGGLLGGPTYWLPLIPVMAGNLLGKKSVPIWTIITILSVIFIYFSKNVGIHITGSTTPTINTFVLSMCILMNGIIIYLMEYKHSQYEKQILDNQAESDEQQRFQLISKLSNKLSHEINNPLAILVLIQKRLERMNEKSPESKMDDLITKNKKTLERINKVVSTFQNLNNNLFTNSSHSVSINILMNNLQELYAEQFYTQKINYRVELKPKDKDIVVSASLTLVLMTLIDNSIESLQEEKNRVLMIRFYSSSSSDIINIDIEDNGRGIEESNVSKIFELFYSTKLVSGVGTGLCIAKKLAIDCNGDIKLISAKNNTIFQVSFPKKHA